MLHRDTIRTDRNRNYSKTNLLHSACPCWSYQSLRKKRSKTCLRIQSSVDKVYSEWHIERKMPVQISQKTKITSSPTNIPRVKIRRSSKSSQQTFCKTSHDFLSWAVAEAITFTPRWNVGVCVCEFWELPGNTDRNQTHIQTHSCNPLAPRSFRREEELDVLAGKTVVFFGWVDTALRQGLPLVTGTSVKTAGLPACQEARSTMEGMKKGRRKPEREGA